MRQSSIFKEAGVAPDHFMPRQIALADPMTQWLYPCSSHYDWMAAQASTSERKVPSDPHFPRGVNETRDRILRRLAPLSLVPVDTCHAAFYLEQFQKECANLALALRYTRIHLLDY